MKTGRHQKTRDQKPEARKILAWCLSALWFLVSGFVHGADFQASATLDRTQIALNEQAVLSLTLTGSGNLPQAQLPGIPDFQVYNAGSSQSYTWTNGKASASVTYNYVLTPSKEGRFTIPSLHIESNGQTADTAPLSLEVVKGDPSAVQGSARQGGTAQPAAAPSTPAVFITGTADKTSVYVGEPITFTFRLYYRVALLSRPNYQPPEMSGFWTEDLPPQRNFNANVKGMPYSVTEVRTALFPSAPGKARIGSATLAVNLENFGTDPYGSNFFAQFFGRGEEKVMRTEPISVNVKPLPAGKPTEFKGAVGHYTLSAQLDKEKVSVGQPVTLSLTVSGRGNIKSIPDLALPPLANFRTFDANAATNIEKKDGEVSGSKVFKTVLIPTASGDLSIPPISFAYFDPSEHAYRTVRSQAKIIRVTPSAGGAVSTGVLNQPASLGEPSPAPGIKMLGEDIRYIRTPRSISSVGDPLYRRKWFRYFHLLLGSLLVFAGCARLYHRLFLSDTVLYRFRKAHEQAKASLKSADTMLSGQDARKTGGYLAELLQDYLAAKLGVQKRTRSLKEIVDALRTRGLSSHTGAKVRNIWEMLDLLQFAPSQTRPDEIRQAMQTVEHVIEEIEKEVVWKNGRP